MKLPCVLHDYPSEFFKYHSRFNGEDHITTEEHMDDFEWFTALFEIMHEYVFMRTFSQSLDGNTRLWFKSMEPNFGLEFGMLIQ